MTTLREYVLEQGYVWRGLTPDSYGYEQCLQYVLHGLYRKLDPGDRLFTRILLECPEITEGGWIQLSFYFYSETTYIIYSLFFIFLSNKWKIQATYFHRGVI